MSVAPFISVAPLSLRFVLILMLGLAVSGCGRRGALEAPPERGSVAVPGSAARASDDEAEEGDDRRGALIQSVVPNPAKKRPRGFVIPKDPFVLDPIL
jgi:predicted small lipoprotein YifL